MGIKYYNPEDISNLIKPIIDNQADFVVGSRYLSCSSYKIPLYAHVGKFFISLCLWFLYHQKIRKNQISKILFYINKEMKYYLEMQNILLNDNFLIYND